MLANRLPALFVALCTVAPLGRAQCLDELASPVPEGSFGSAVAADSGRWVVGASSANGVGAAYVFERAAGFGSQPAELEGSDLDSGSRFGDAVAIAGDVAVVGAPLQDGTGAVYVFELTALGWVETAKLSAAAPLDFDRFGRAVAVAGDTIFVGSERSPLGSNTGAAHVFERVAGTWQWAALLLQADVASTDDFGYALAAEGDDAVVICDPTDGILQGAAYRFVRTATGWEQQQKIQPPFVLWGDTFALSAAVSGEYLLVGSKQLGGVLFRREGTSWVTAQVLFGGPSEAGLDVALSGTTAVLSGRDDDSIAPFGIEVWERVGGDWTRSAYVRTGVIPRQPAVDSRTVLVGAPSFSGVGRVLTLDLIGVVQSCFCPLGPCGNPGSFGCSNSTSSGGNLRACGTASVGADDLRLTVEDVPAFVPSLVFLGATAPAGTYTFFGDGRICVDPVADRFPLRDSGASGGFVEGPGLVAYSLANFASPITAGATWTFQAWYRDPSGPCGSGSNVTNTVRLTFVP